MFGTVEPGVRSDLRRLETAVDAGLALGFNGSLRALKWSYVSTRCWTIFCGDISDMCVPLT